MEMTFSILVGVLSVLVVILIGWQIYTTVNIQQETKDIRTEVNGALKRVNTEYGRLSAAVYSVIFDEKRKKNDDVYGYFKYGLLVLLHSESFGNIPLCLSMIQALTESFPVNQPIKNSEKADILSIAARISETSIGNSFGKLHGLIITKIPSID